MIIRTTPKELVYRIDKRRDLLGYTVMSSCFDHHKLKGTVMYRVPGAYPIAVLAFEWFQCCPKFKEPIYEFKMSGPDHLLNHLRKTAFAGLWEIK